MNLANFRLVLARIKANPEKWNQYSWCGSRYCLAGHAARMSGDNKRAAWDAAADFLDLDHSKEYTWRQFAWLFHANRTLKDFERVAAGEIDEHGQDIGERK